MLKLVGETSMTQFDAAYCIYTIRASMKRGPEHQPRPSSRRCLFLGAILRSSPYPAIDLPDERPAVLVAPLVVLQPRKLVDRQSIQPRGNLPNALLVVASDRQVPVGGSGRVYGPRSLLCGRLLSAPGHPLGVLRSRLEGLRPLTPEPERVVGYPT